MMVTDKDALECDLAETYHIYDCKKMPPMKVALFACGLRDDSRIKLKMADSTHPLETVLLASIADNLAMLVWFQTEDGQKGRNRPKSVLAILTGENKKENKVFMTGEDFEKERNRILREGGG